MNKLSFGVAVLSMLSSTSSHADWSRIGAAARCDSEKKAFMLMSTIESSAPEYDVVAPSGFGSFKEGSDQHYICDIGGVDIEMTINVYGPQARGMGQGSGVIIIEKLAVGKYLLIEKPTNFNWGVMDEQILSEIRVWQEAGGEYKSEMCYGQQCTTTNIELNG